MTRNRTSTGTRTYTETQSKTFVQNQLFDLYFLIGSENDADSKFAREHRKQLNRIFELGLEKERLDEVRYVIVDRQDRVVDEWVLDISYIGNGRYEIETPTRETIQREAQRHGSRGGYKALIIPIVDGSNVFAAPEIDGVNIDSFGGPGVGVDIRRQR